jgi:hypothetical protein
LADRLFSTRHILGFTALNNYISSKSGYSREITYTDIRKSIIKQDFFIYIFVNKQCGTSLQWNVFTVERLYNCNRRRDVPPERLYSGTSLQRNVFTFLILQFPIGGARAARGVPPPPRLLTVLLSTICNA